MLLKIKEHTLNEIENLLLDVLLTLKREHENTIIEEDSMGFTITGADILDSINFEALALKIYNDGYDKVTCIDYLKDYINEEVGYIF